MLESQDLTNLSITLPDGRRLGYAELGDEHGRPLFFFHGTPGSRLVLSERDAIAQIEGVRLILPERPGYGVSDPKPDRTLVGWADDVAALADHLGVERFAVAGVSGGGPHALACAARLPERVTAVLLLASPSPAGFRGVTRGMSFGNRIGLLLGRFAPGLVRRSIVSYAASFESDPDRFLDGIARQMSEPDRHLMVAPEVREAVARDVREAYRQGGHGHADDAALAMTSQSWGFDLSAIDVPVYLWHGEVDALASRAMAEHLAEALPECKAHFVAGAGHLLTEHDGVVDEFSKALEASAA